MIAGFWAGNTMASTDKAAQAKKQRQRMKVVIKMFFVMGLSWIADIVSWGLAEALNNLEIYKNAGLRYTSLVFAIINSCQVSVSNLKKSFMHENCFCNLGFDSVLCGVS